MDTRIVPMAWCFLNAWAALSQVRSKEMHQKAEFGLAAHWSYKGTGSLTSSLDWITEDKSTPPRDNKVTHVATLAISMQRTHCSLVIGISSRAVVIIVVCTPPQI